MADRRIYELSTTTDLTGKFLAVDVLANPAAEKFAADDLVTLSGAQTITGQKTFSLDTIFDAEIHLQDSATRIFKDGSNNMVFEDSVSGSNTLASLLGGGAWASQTLTADVTIDGDNGTYDIVFSETDIVHLNAGINGVGQRVDLYLDSTFSYYRCVNALDEFGGIFLTASAAKLEWNDSVATMNIDMIGATGMIVTDEINDKGLEYAGDYSSNYTARSIVDKAYVDAGGGGYTFENGLTEAAGTVILGGTLNQDTIIYGIETYKFTLQSTTQVIIHAGNNNVNAPPGAWFQALETLAIIKCWSTTTVFSEVRAYDDEVRLVNTVASVSKTLSITPTSMLITDDQDSKGLEYAADYSGAWTDRSLVDKAYVDAGAGGGIAWVGATVNGIGTFVDANTIQAEANLTFTGSVLTVTATSNAGVVVTGGTGRADLSLQGASGLDAKISFSQVTTVQYIAGYDASFDQFQIHSGSVFTSAASGDFTIEPDGAVYMGNLAAAVGTHFLKYNPTTGLITYD
jgi:drug/metabolite transporter superfamily protein YnfA